MTEPAYIHLVNTTKPLNFMDSIWFSWFAIENHIEYDDRCDLLQIGISQKLQPTKILKLLTNNCIFAEDQETL